jgi:hypothetical protein
MLHTFLIVIEILIGVAALAGGVFALLGAAGVPQAWLEGAPFSTYRIPGVILIVVVGGTSLTAAGLLLGSHSSSRLMSVLAGVVLLGWAAGETTYLNRRHWTQGASAILGIAITIPSLLLPAPG